MLRSEVAHLHTNGDDAPPPPPTPAQHLLNELVRVTVVVDGLIRHFKTLERPRNGLLSGILVVLLGIFFAMLFGLALLNELVHRLPLPQ